MISVVPGFQVLQANALCEICFPNICTHADIIYLSGGGHVFCFEYNRQDVVVCAESLGFRIYKRKGLGCISFTVSVPYHITNNKVRHASLNHNALCCARLEYVLYLGVGAGGELVAVYSSSTDEQ